MKRRDFLAGLAATLPATAYGAGVVRPIARQRHAQAQPDYRAILNASGLGDITGFLVVDLATGAVREAHQHGLQLPPASVTKAVTALYAQQYLGAAYRFDTQVLITGPVAGGTLNGDLILQGSGDPMLDTDRLASLSADVARAGIQRISGRFIFADQALPRIAQIDNTQPVQAGYNPGLSGLNLNYNRVYFEWSRANNDYAVSMDARSERFRPAVDMAQMAVVNRGAPVYTFQQSGGVEHWTVARAALGNGGGRWLPVRDAGLYAAQVFQSLAAANGIRLPAPERRAMPNGAQAIAQTQSAGLTNILSAMLRYSTNLTAEVLGLKSSLAGGQSGANLALSALAMGRWAADISAGSVGDFVNHSGLSAASRASAQNLVQIMRTNAARVGLRNLLRETVLVNAQGNAAPVAGCQIFAKTGTLNFVHGLSGYIEKNGQQRLAFAIFAADMNARANVSDDQERPRGARTWLGKARAQEQALLRRWANIYA